MSAFPKPDWLQTGDNKPLTGKALEAAAKDLCKNHHWKNMRALKDRKGIFGYVMRDAEGNRIIVVAKGSPIYRQTTSVQAFLPSQAAAENTPLVIAVLATNAEPVYYVFNPEEIKRKSYGFDDRFGVQFINFPASLGIQADPRNIHAEYVKMRRSGFQARLS